MRVEWWVLTLAAVVGAGLAVAGAAWVPGPPGRTTVPAAGELAPLERYLTPVAVDAGAGVTPRRVVIDGSPFRAPATAPRAEPGRPAVEPAPRWSLTAILIAGERRIASVNDRRVRPGDRLDDGARVVEVERGHVVLITPGGERRRLELER